MNTISSMRNPQIFLGPLIAQIVVYPLGTLWGKYVTKKKFRIFGNEFTANPGPFTEKEHTLIVIMTNVSLAPPL